jgi:hypothetical protein
MGEVKNGPQLTKAQVLEMQMQRIKNLSHHLVSLLLNVLQPLLFRHPREQRLLQLFINPAAEK